MLSFPFRSAGLDYVDLYQNNIIPQYWALQPAITTFKYHSRWLVTAFNYCPFACSIQSSMYKTMDDHTAGSEQDLNHSKASPSQEGTAMPALTTIPTSITLSTEQFEKLYLTPLRHRQPALTKTFGNPTPLCVTDLLLFATNLEYSYEIYRALGGFVVTTTPLSCCLMAWRGAGGNGIAFT